MLFLFNLTRAKAEGKQAIAALQTIKPINLLCGGYLFRYSGCAFGLKLATALKLAGQHYHIVQLVNLKHKVVDLSDLSRA